ncbi:MAG: hypothetical protein Q8N13_22700 [Acidovorax sp.]|nr:hypothetical protein [Acidovorax sp.]
MSAARPQEIEMLVWLNSPSGDSGIESYGEGAITILESLPYAMVVREIVVFGCKVTDAHQPFAILVSALSAYMSQWRSLMLLAVSSPKVSCVARISPRHRDNTVLRDGTAAGFFSAAKPNLRNAP